MTEQSPMELQPGSELAGYRVEGVLGSGGVGIVYRAFDLALGRSIALKLLAPELAQDPGFRERFHRESRLAASLDHPAVVPIYDAGEVDGQLYIAMRLVEGADLKQLIREEGRLQPSRVLSIVSQIGEALDAAHELGLVHRDVKPSNVLLDSRGHCYLADFGLSRLLSDQQSQTDGRSLGTSDYIAPEQIRGEKAVPQSDVYSLGCLLYECISGEPPFRRASELATVFAHLEESPAPLPKLERVVERALAKDPADRYASCAELVAAASAALGLQRRSSRRLFVVGSLGTFAVLAAAVAAMLLRDADASVRESAVLAEQAVAAAASDPRAALRLALEAARTARTARSESALRVALALDPLEATLRGHSASVNAAVFSPDGRWLVTASDDETARIWDARNGRSLRVLRGHLGPVGSAGFSPNGRRILTVGGNDRTVRIWDAATGRAVRVLRPRNGLVQSATYSPTGEKIVAVTDVGVRVWDARSGRPLLVLRGAFGSAVFSPDGKHVLTASYAAARIWDTATGRSLRMFLPRGGGIGGAAYSSDGQRIITFGGRPRIWDATTGRQIHTLGKSDLAWYAGFSSDGRLILTVESPESSPYAGGSARVWDAATGRQRHLLPPGVTTAVFSTRAAEVATADVDGSVRLWDAKSGTTLQTLNSDARSQAPREGDGLRNSVTLDSRGVRAATYGGRDGSVRIWRLASIRGRPFRQRSLVVTVSAAGVAQVRDAVNGRSLQVLDGHFDPPPSSWVFTRDRERVIAADGNTARIWSTNTGHLLRVLRGHSGRVRSATFSLDGKLAATAGDDTTARIWDSARGRQLRVLRGHGRPVYSVVFSHDGKHSVTSSADGAVRVWNVSTGVIERVLRGHSGTVVSAVFSADGKQVVSAGLDGTTRIWEIEKGRAVRVLRTGAVLGAVFSPNGNVVLTVGASGLARIWDAATGTVLHVLGRGSPIDRAAFSLDGRRIIGARGDEPRRVWDCDVCGMSFRELRDRAESKLASRP